MEQVKPLKSMVFENWILTCENKKKLDLYFTPYKVIQSELNTLRLCQNLKYIEENIGKTLKDTYISDALSMI